MPNRPLEDKINHPTKTNTCSDTSNQRSALNRTRHLEIRKPLPNQSLRGEDFDLIDHGIKYEQLIVAHGSDIISWKESDGQPLVHQLKSWVMNVAAPRCELAMDNLTRNLAPKFITIKTAASLIERNRPVFVEIKVAGNSFPRKQIFFPEKSKINPIFHLPKSAKKLDGEESRTILLNGNEIIPSKVFVHICFDEEVRIECSGVDEALVLEDGVALSLTIISQVEVRCIIRINFYDLGLRFGLHLFVLFFFLIVHRA